MAGETIDQGRFWWPPGLPGQESVRVLFNQALGERPGAIKLEDYETRAPIDADFHFEQQGCGKWARWTAATVRIKEPAQRGRPFRWTLTK